MDVEDGINLIDTGPVYGCGRFEEILGRAVAECGHRESLVMATKVGIEWPGDRVFGNSSRQRILREIDDSLRRLETSYVDIYRVHWPDPRVPIQQTAETMAQLFRGGKIRAVGVSNYSPEQQDALPLNGSGDGRAPDLLLGTFLAGL